MPILIELHALEKSHDLDVLVAQHLVRAGMDAEPGKFRYMLREGRVALLFDGFDELALRVSYDRALDHFETLTAAACRCITDATITRRVRGDDTNKVVIRQSELKMRRVDLGRGTIQRIMEDAISWHLLDGR